MLVGPGIAVPTHPPNKVVGSGRASKLAYCHFHAAFR